jgi:hypothetical protein
MNSLRERFNTNTIIGVLLLVALFSLAGDEVITLIANQVPGQVVTEAFPCSWLPTPEDLGNHQSLIARRAIADGTSLDLMTRASTVPTTPDGVLTIRILVINSTLGTVPFIYNPDTVIVGDNNTSGLGIIFDPPSNIVLPGINLRADPATYPENAIRVLGPQQRCIHTLEFTQAQLDNNIQSGNSTVQAYYRGVSAGAVPPANPTPIYPDQGLPTGLTVSNPVAVLRPPG